MRTKVINTTREWHGFRQLLTAGALSWLLWAVKVHLCVTWSICVPEVRQEKDSMQCFFSSGYQPFVKG